MLKTLLSQTGWSMIGTVFGFSIGFFVKMYLINSIGAESFGLYTIATSFQGAISTLISFAIPKMLVKFLPKYLSEKDSHAATVLASKSLIFLMISSILSALTIVLLSYFISSYLFQKPNLTYILSIAAIYIPLTLYSAYLTSVYRSFLKIKEIVLYGTIYMISIRAVLTFIVYNFTNEIIYFLFIEIVSMAISSALLTLHFRSDKMHLFEPKAVREELDDKKEIIKYTKTIYANSLIGFSGGYAMMFVMSILLPASAIGVFAILMTIAGLTNFLQTNINTVFAPIISSLVSKGDIDELSEVYRESTFLINFATIPFIAIAVLFSKDILGLYGSEFSPHTFELMVLFMANYISLTVGSSGTLMLMGGLEKEELYLQIFILIFTLASSFLLLSLYGLLAVVFIRLATMFIVNTVEVYFIYRRFKLWPWDRYSYLLMALFIFLLVFSYKYHTYDFSLWHYILIPVVLYGSFVLMFRNKILLIKRVVLKK